MRGRPMCSCGRVVLSGLALLLIGADGFLPTLQTCTRGRGSRQSNAARLLASDSWESTNSNSEGKRRDWVGGRVPGVNYGPMFQATDENLIEAASRAPPLKVMVFVDGTWLYYSFFGRGERCHILSKLGTGWFRNYRIKWEMLPVIVARAVQAELTMGHQPGRLVEVVRTVVFSSAHESTPRESNRMQMFDAMRKLNFEVHMSTTTGVQEKCIDIALAVEMLHYATIPDAYDVAILVTGDKDFMPAMSRTRQKGRRVGLCSMRNSCNMDLLDPEAHILDLNPIWINESLDDLLEHAPRHVRSVRTPRILPEVLCKLVSGIIAKEGGVMRSRELGRSLNSVTVLDDGTSALAVIKEGWTSLSKFLVEHSDVFKVSRLDIDRNREENKTIEFIVSLVDREDSMKSVKLGEVTEKSISLPISEEEEEEDSDEETEMLIAAGDGGVVADELWMEEDEIPVFEDLLTKESLMGMKVLQLKELLKAQGLPGYGKKTTLVERLLSSQGTVPPSPRTSESPNSFMRGAMGEEDNVTEVGIEIGVENGWGSSTVAGAWTGAQNSAQSSSHYTAQTLPVPENSNWGMREEGQEVFQHIHASLAEMIRKAVASSGGVMNSRQLGRVLANLSAPEGASEGTALKALKARWPSLLAFINTCPGEFKPDLSGKLSPAGASTYGFNVENLANGLGIGNSTIARARSEG
ncbi:unnamed protein product [Choristocarpus tenellus]